MKTLIKNEIYESEIEGYTSEALGVCRINGSAVFVPYALSGEKAKIKITKTASSYSYGRIEKLLSVSPVREIPGCSCYKQCGGCSTLHMDYAEELRFKLDKVNDCFSRIGKQSVLAQKIIPADFNEAYRNKVTFSIGKDESGAYLGFYSARSHKVVKIENCLIQDPRALETGHAVIDFINEHGFAPYDESMKTGWLRHIFIRRAIRTEDYVVCLTSARGFGDKTAAFKEHLINTCPYITGIVLNINKEPGNELLKGEFYTLYGCPDVRDILLGKTFQISPQSFYQIYPQQAEKLYKQAINYLSEFKKQLILDLYCGIGTISLSVSGHCRKVIGVEIVPQAIENAKRNAELNNITNAEFICADAGDALKVLCEREITPDAIIVDPPRKGMSPEAIEFVCEMQPDNIVYISCNPATLARDIPHFGARDYKLVDATAVDMFPGTFHVETVVLMSRK